MFKKKCNLTDGQINEKANKLLTKMTLKEKVWLLNGNWKIIKNIIKHKNPYNPTPIKTNGCERLGITPIKFTDGPRGVVMGHSTCFPVSMARGASFDIDLERRVGDVIGKEARAQGANYFAGVCINLLRHPAWGRAQETYGEDPFHIGEFGRVLTEAVQEHNVMACVKHYALNSIENSRFRVSVECDERTLREVYLPHFKKCFDAGAASVMGAYNKFRGEHCCESDHLLNKILRDEWGFEGFSSSDFIFGIRDTKKAIESGMDVEMPMPIHYQKKLLEAVKNKEVSEATLDTAVLRVLKTLLVFDNSTEKMSYTEDMIACSEHVELAREAAEKSMVLIKNKDNVLPFNKDIKKILVVGKLATKANTGDFGSSRIYAPYVVTQLEGFKNYFNDQVEIVYCNESEIEKAKDVAKICDCVVIIAGNDARDEGECVMPDPKSTVDYGDCLYQGTKNQGSPIQALVIKKFAKSNPYTSQDGEAVGGDRSSLSLKKDEIKIIKELGGINPNTVVALIGGSMIMTKEWDESVPAILYAWYSGMEGGNALPRLLFGDINPSGKLPFTIPFDEIHLPFFSSDDDTIEYDLYHGYTLLDKNQTKPMYPFGYGLSYSKFEYSDLKLKKDKQGINVSVKVKNNSDIQGEEVIQVYTGVEKSKIDRQRKLLKAFDKKEIMPYQEKEVNLFIPFDELRYFNNEANKWEFEHGRYIIWVGSSSCETDLLNELIEL